jgi:hypothetical protein
MADLVRKTNVGQLIEGPSGDIAEVLVTAGVKRLAVNTQATLTIEDIQTIVTQVFTNQTLTNAGDTDSLIVTSSFRSKAIAVSNTGSAGLTYNVWASPDNSIYFKLTASGRSVSSGAKDFVTVTDPWKYVKLIASANTGTPTTCDAWIQESL